MGQPNRSSELPAVVVACAAADRDALLPALKRLSNCARLSRISGMQRSTERAKHVVARCGLEAIYVVVRSEHLDTADVQRALEGLRAEGVAADNLVVAELVTGMPLSVVPSVRAALRRLGFGPDAEAVAAQPAAGREDPEQTQPFSPTPGELRRRAERARAISRGEAVADELDTGSREALAAASVLPRRTPPRARVGVVAGLGLAVLTTAAALAASGVNASSESAVSASVAQVAAVETPVQEVEPPQVAEPEPEPMPTVPAPVFEPEPEPELVLEDIGPEPIDFHAAMMEGLRSRTLRAYDGLVFTAEPLLHKVHFVRATAYCRNYEFEGVGDWRLPTAGELVSLAEVAGFGRRDRVWSSTKGSDGEILTFDSRKEELLMKDRLWSGGRVICVRENSSES